MTSIVMPSKTMGFAFLALTILFTVYGQLVIKSQVSRAGEFPLDTSEKVIFMLRLLLNPLVLSGMVAAFLASLAWMATLTQFELSFAYPFMSISFVAVITLSILLFGEQLTVSKVVGTLIIITGLVVLTR